MQNQLGQKRSGICETTKYLYEHYSSNSYELVANDVERRPNLHFLSDTNLLEKNLRNLYISNYKLLDENDFNINIGSDHSLAIGSVASTLNIYKSNIKVIWIDAHADINTKNSSPSNNVHGMPLSFLTGLDTSDNYDYIKNTLGFENLCYIGIRDLDPFEIDTIKKHNIKTISSDEFNSNINSVLKDIIEWVGTTPVHLSLDVDGLDPSIIQFTGTRCNNGLQLEQTIKFLQILCKCANIVNADITELNLYNPDCKNIYGEEERTKSFKNFDALLKAILFNL